MKNCLSHHSLHAVKCKALKEKPMIVSSRFIFLGTLAVVIPLFAFFLWCFIKKRNTRRKTKFRKPGRKERAQYQKVNAKCSGEEEEAIEHISIAVKSEKVTPKGKEGNIINEVLCRVAKRGNQQETELTLFQEDNKMRKKNKNDKEGKKGGSSEKKKTGKEEGSSQKDGKGKKSSGKSNKVGVFSCKSNQTGSDGDDLEMPNSIGQRYAKGDEETSHVGASKMSTRQTKVGTDGSWTASVVSKDQELRTATNSSAKRNLFGEGSECCDAVQQKKCPGRSDANDNEMFGVRENPDAKRDVRKRPDQQHYVPPAARKGPTDTAGKRGSADTAGKRNNPWNKESRNVKRPFEKEVLNDDEKQAMVNNIDPGREKQEPSGANIIEDSNVSLRNNKPEKTVYENLRDKELEKAKLPDTLYDNLIAPNPTKQNQSEVFNVRDDSTYENTYNLRYSSTGRFGSQHGEKADSVHQTGKLQQKDIKAKDAEIANSDPVYETVSSVKPDVGTQNLHSGGTGRSKTTLEIKIQSKVNKDNDEQKQKDSGAGRFKRSISQKVPSKKEKMNACQTEALQRSRSEERLLEKEKRPDVLARGGSKIRVQNGVIFIGDSKADALVNRTAEIVKQSSEKERGRNLSGEKERAVKVQRPESVTAPLLIDDYAASEWKGETLKADKIRRGYERVKRETGLICIRRIRGDNYCALRAVLFKALSSGIDIMMRFRKEGSILELPHLLLAEKHTWIRDWSFAKRLPLLNNSVEDTLTDCLSLLEETVVRSTSCYDDKKRYKIILDKMNGSEGEEVKLFEAVKFLMLYNSIKLHKGMLNGQETSILPMLLFARDTSTEPRSFMKNHLNHVGDSGGLDQLEMILLGHTLKIVIIVMRLHQVDEQDFIAQFPDDLQDPEDKVYLVAEDDRHYNALSEEA